MTRQLHRPFRTLTFGLLALGLGLTATAAMPASAAPSAADSRVEGVWAANDANEPQDDYGDFKRVRVEATSDRVKFKLQHWGHIGYEVDYFIDTRPGRPGPEFSAYIFADDTRPLTFYVAKTKGFWVNYTDNTVCEPRNVKTKNDWRLLTSKFKLKCLAHKGKTPDRIRVSVQGTADESYGDRLPGAWGGPRVKHRWGPWIEVAD